MEQDSLPLGILQETTVLPPPANSEILEDIGVLRSCLLLARSISNFREAYARCRSPETAGRLMLALQAREHIARKNQILSMQEFYTANIISDPSNDSFVRMEEYINACLDCSREAREKPLSIKSLTGIASHFLMDKISWRMPEDKLTENLLLPSNQMPNGEKLNHQLRLWELYARSYHNVDPYVHLILTYLYFLALSPLNKANQRVASILLQIGLMRKKIDTPFPCIQVDKAIKTNPHFGLEEKLHALRTGQWGPYLRYSLRTLTKAYEYSLELLESLERLFDQTINYLQRLGLEAHTHFIHTIFTFPCCRTGEFSSITGTRRQMSSHILNDLTNADVLERTEDGRDKIFVNKRLIELMESPKYSFSPFPKDIMPFTPLYQKGIPGKLKREMETAKLYSTN
ncbi:MAG: hypothetical protein LUC43_06310 [Burkholderiales bacterium]|nr:hypothetical protein [Burkholderiales bacterium]